MTDAQPPGNVIFDLDGVVYVADRPVPGAGDTLRTLEREGFRLLFATNNASRTRAAGAEKITRLTGHRVTEDQVITSAMAAASLLVDSRLRCFVVGGAGLRDAIVAQGSSIVERWERADVVLTGFYRDLTYEVLRDATLAIRAGARFIATNDDATFPAGNGLWPGAGATVAYLRTATDVQPEIAGKPNPPMRRLISSQLGPGPVWMIGDRVETDLAMAKAEGWSAVLALTGVTGRPEDVPEQIRPDATIASIADLPAVVGLRT